MSLIYSSGVNIANFYPVGSSKYPTLASALAAMGASPPAGTVIYFVPGDTYTWTTTTVIPAGVMVCSVDASQVQVGSVDAAALTFGGNNTVFGIDWNPSNLVCAAAGNVELFNCYLGNSDDLFSIQSGVAAGYNYHFHHNYFYDANFDMIRIGNNVNGGNVIVEDNQVNSIKSGTNGGFFIGMQTQGFLTSIISRRNNIVRVEPDSTGLTYIQTVASSQAGQTLVLSERNRCRFSTNGVGYGLNILNGGVATTQRLPLMACVEDMLDFSGVAGNKYGVYGATLAGFTKTVGRSDLVRSNYSDYTITGVNGANQQVVASVSPTVRATATAGATVSLDVDAAQVYEWTAGENETINLTGTFTAGKTIALLITNDGTARTITFGTGFRTYPAQVGIVNKQMLVNFESDGTAFVMTGLTKNLYP